MNINDNFEFLNVGAAGRISSAARHGAILKALCA